jgi:hypothetical protein
MVTSWSDNHYLYASLCIPQQTSQQVSKTSQQGSCNKITSFCTSVATCFTAIAIEVREWDFYGTHTDGLNTETMKAVQRVKSKTVPLPPCGRQEGEEIYLLLVLDLGTRMGECSASRSGRALTPEKGPPVPIVQEAGWAPEPVWTQRLEEKSFASAGDWTPVVRSVVRHYIDWAIPAPVQEWLLEKYEGKRPLERIKRKWKYNIRVDVKEVWCEDATCDQLA